MQNNINNLLESYMKFAYSTSEYNIITNNLKNFTKNHGDNVIIDYYSLKIKRVDKSTYTNEIISYLKEKNLNQFIEEKVDDNKICNLIELGVLNKDLVINNIENEKTVLDIKMINFKESLALFEEDLKKQIKSTDLKKCIQKRESLKYQINEHRYNYYKFAKQIKDSLSDNNISQYRFQYKEDIGILKIKTLNRTYTKDFRNYLKNTNLDALVYSVNSQALLKSKSKKIDREIVNQFKIENYQEYLYVKILRGLFNKKIKNKKNRR